MSIGQPSPTAKGFTEQVADRKLLEELFSGLYRNTIIYHERITVLSEVIKCEISVIDLVGKVTSDEAAWTGKEVVVSGYLSFSPGNTDPITLNLVEDLHSGTESHIYCKVPKAAVTDDLDKKLVTVKGKIGKVHTQNYLKLKTVTLKQCELVK